MKPGRPRRRAVRLIRVITAVVAIGIAAVGLRDYLSFRSQQEASAKQAAYWSLQSQILTLQLEQIPFLPAQISAAERLLGRTPVDGTGDAIGGMRIYLVRTVSSGFGIPLGAVLDSLTGLDFDESPPQSSIAASGIHDSVYACTEVDNPGGAPVVTAIDSPPDFAVNRARQAGLFCAAIIDRAAIRNLESLAARVPAEAGDINADIRASIRLPALSHAQSPMVTGLTEGEIAWDRSQVTALARQLAGAGTYGASSSPLRERDDMLVGGAGVMLLIMAFAVRRYRLPAWTRVSAGREGRLTRGPAFPDLAGRDWALAVASALVASAVAALDDPGDQARYREEWSGDLAEIAGTWSRLWWALGVRLTARSLRAAYRVPSAKTY